MFTVLLKILVPIKSA